MAVAIEEAKQKERERKLKEMRREIEDKILEKIPEDAFDQRAETVADHYEEIKEVDQATMKRILESLLFVSQKPLNMSEIKKVIKGYKPSEIQSAIRELQEEYEARGSSFRLQEIAGGYELSTLPQYSQWVMKLELEKRRRQASQSSLETLAILAYKQPVTRVEIEEIRGVNVSGVLSTLLERNLIKIVGRKEIPGRPLLYGTTDKFLGHFGLKSIEELPKIDEIKDLVARMVNQEELMGQENAQGSDEQTSGNSEPNEPEEVIPSNDERTQVLEEVSAVIKNTNTKFDISKLQQNGNGQNE